MTWVRPRSDVESCYRRRLRVICVLLNISARPIFIVREATVMPFTYVASASSKGNENIRRVCNNSKCGGAFYIASGAQNYRCPHCDFAQ